MLIVFKNAHVDKKFLGGNYEKYCNWRTTWWRDACYAGVRAGQLDS
jgi:hypothetical protein